MATSRKWWHTELTIKDRNNNIKSIFTTIDVNNINTNFDNSIYAYPLYSNSSVSIPVASYSDDSPGNFLFMPSVSDLNNSFIIANNFQDVVSIDKRRIFEYTTFYAINSNDIDCSAIFPDTLINSAFDSTINTENSIVLSFPHIEYISTLTCCSDVPLGNPGDELPSPGNLLACTRMWILTLNSNNTNNLYSYDFNPNNTPQLINRGKIKNSDTSFNFYGIAWDDRDFLWILEKNSIRKLFFGDSSIDAIVSDPVIVTNSTGLFPIISSSVSIDFNQNNNKMYIFANNKLWCLEKDGGLGWNIINQSQEFEEATVKGLAFSQFNEAFCFKNNNLCRIEINQGINFGNITPVVDNNIFTNFEDLDFIYDYSQESVLFLYSINSTGQIFKTNKQTATYLSIPGADIDSNIIATCSCLSGENTRFVPFPFYPSSSPWMFLIDTSSSMSGNKISKIKNTMAQFLTTYVRNGDKITVKTFGSSSYEIIKILNTISDTNEVIDFISGLTTGGFVTNFCEVFDNISQNNNDLMNIIILSDGTFDDCGNDFAEWQNHFSNTWNSIILTNPQVVMQSVGVEATDINKLTYLGNIRQWRIYELVLNYESI